MKTLHLADHLSANVPFMLIHRVAAGSEGRGRSLKGLCGAPVEGIYVRALNGRGGTRAHFCPNCEAISATDVPPGRRPSSGERQVTSRPEALGGRGAPKHA